MSGRIEDIVARLHGLHPRLIDLSLDRLHDLLAKLDHPERRLPPVVHVAGTNGKGSTCAFLRAMAEAAGQRVHVYTSPHLVRFNERIRIAGELVSDEALIAALEQIEQVNAGAPITVFEVITAVAFHLFAETPAELCVLEVGLGGRGDATNVIDRPAACAITSISLDHRELLGADAGSHRRRKGRHHEADVPVAIGAQPAEVLEVLLAAAARVGAPVRLRGRDWASCRRRASLQRRARHASALPAPSLPGAFQLDNAGIAIAALRAAAAVPHAIPPASPTRNGRRGCSACTAGWPRCCRRTGSCGWTAATIPAPVSSWPSICAAWADRPVHLVVGMKQAKDSAEFLRPLLPFATTSGRWANRTACRAAGRGDRRGLGRRRPAGSACRGRAARRCRATRRRPGADLRQPVPGRRGAEAGCMIWRRTLRRAELPRETRSRHPDE